MGAASGASRSKGTASTYPLGVRPGGAADQVSGELIPTGCPARMLALLDRPRHVTELPQLLDVTRQRVHQAVHYSLDAWFDQIDRSKPP